MPTAPIKGTATSHQWGYTAPGVLEKTGQHAAHPTVVENDLPAKFLHMGGTPLEKA
jgi:hypothetical protein